jgi:hypothetical protein
VFKIEFLLEGKAMCEYCNHKNTREYLQGCDGIVYDKNDNKYYLFIEHFIGEKYNIEVKYCPKCGVKL